MQILACGSCQQHFLSVFTETIDWADGDDPQHWSVLPLTEAEQRTLCQRGPAPSETTLHALAPSRRSLHRDHPKAAAPHTAWGTGVRVGPHD